jgi:hypothetical protein
MRWSRYQCVSAWMACFAILLASLAPAISHAVNAARTAQPAQQEHCLKESEAMAHAGHAAPAEAMHDAPDADHAASHELHFEHCPFCFIHAGSFALMPSFAVQAGLLPARAQRPLLFYQSHQPLYAWASAQPRAPPAVS